MNKLYALFITLFMMSVTAHAQQFGGGLMGGVVGSQVHGDSYVGFDKGGIYAGGFVNLQVNPQGLMQMELNFIQKGSRHNPDPEQGDFTEYLMRLNYVEIPVIYKYLASERFSVEGGLSYGYLVHEEETFLDREIYADKDFKKHAANILFGFYYKLIPDLDINMRVHSSAIPVREHSSGAKWLLNRGQYNFAISITGYYSL